MNSMIAQNKRLFVILTSAFTLLMVPLVAMQFTSEVQWSLFDFVVAGVLLFGVGLLTELILRKAPNFNARSTSLIVIFIVFILVWMELAVGIFGTPFAGN